MITGRNGKIHEHVPDLADLLSADYFELRPASLDNNNTNMADPIENMELDFTPIGLESITPHDSNPSKSTIPILPCPVLREVTVELRDPPKTKNAKILCICSRYMFVAPGR